MLTFVVFVCCFMAVSSHEVSRTQGDPMPEILSRLTRVESELDSAKQELEILKRELKHQNDVMESKQQDINRLKVPLGSPGISDINRRLVLGQSETGIAFMAYLDHGVSTLGDGQTIEYNQVVLNEGDAYNPNTGVFTCPTDGVYLFAFFVDAKHVAQIGGYLTVNNRNIVDGIADSFHDWQDVQGGNVAILRLKAGDTVTVRAHHGNTVHNNGGPDTMRFNSFSGALLFL